MIPSRAVQEEPATENKGLYGYWSSTSNFTNKINFSPVTFIIFHVLQI